MVITASWYDANRGSILPLGLSHRDDMVETVIVPCFYLLFGETCDVVNAKSVEGLTHD